MSNKDYYTPDGRKIKGFVYIGGKKVPIVEGKKGPKFNNSDFGKHKEEASSVKEKIQTVKDVMHCDDETAKETFDAIHNFLTTEHREIRKNSEGYEANLIENYIDKKHKWSGGETYRGIGMFNDELSGIKIGDEIDMKGLSSWSSDKDVSIDYASRSQMPNMVIYKSKTQPKGVSITDIAHYYNEKEVLVSSKSKYKVSGIEKGTVKIWKDYPILKYEDEPVTYIELEPIYKKK